jgi:hypothetical protein
VGGGVGTERGLGGPWVSIRTPYQNQIRLSTDFETSLEIFLDSATFSG